mmetsp:Transcript_3613/g.5174  ORF Transcript_3613/g.5174 Transcript_3613/m.5174 type:complete len:228 (-) Transcript_3613:387-1070(-)
MSLKTMLGVDPSTRKSAVMHSAVRASTASSRAHMPRRLCMTLEIPLAVIPTKVCMTQRPYQTMSGKHCTTQQHQKHRLGTSLCTLLATRLTKKVSMAWPRVWKLMLLLRMKLHCTQLHRLEMLRNLLMVLRQIEMMIMVFFPLSMTKDQDTQMVPSTITRIHCSAESHLPITQMVRPKKRRRNSLFHVPIVLQIGVSMTTPPSSNCMTTFQGQSLTVVVKSSTLQIP